MIDVFVSADLTLMFFILLNRSHRGKGECIDRKLFYQRFGIIYHVQCHFSNNCDTSH